MGESLYGTAYSEYSPISSSSRDGAGDSSARVCVPTQAPIAGARTLADAGAPLDAGTIVDAGAIADTSAVVEVGILIEVEALVDVGAAAGGTFVGYGNAGFGWGRGRGRVDVDGSVKSIRHSIELPSSLGLRKAFVKLRSNAESYSILEDEHPTPGKHLLLHRILC